MSSSASVNMPGASLAAMLREVQSFMNSIQRPRLKDSAWVQATLDRCQELQEMVAATRLALANRGQGVSESMEDFLEYLKVWMQEFGERPKASRMKKVTEQLSFRYEAMVQSARNWKETASNFHDHVEHIKPMNYARSIFHVGMGVGAVLLAEVFLTWSQCLLVVGGFALLALVLEVSRRFSTSWNQILVTKVFAPIARPREMYRTNGATYYTLAILILVGIFSKPAAEIGLLVLAFGDPGASLVGKRWGKLKLYRQKSVLGTSVFFALAVAASVFVLSVLHPTLLPWSSRWALALSVAFAGTMAELFSHRLDDNLTIPVACATVASIWLPIF